MQASSEYRRDPNRLWRAANLTIMAVVVTIVVFVTMRLFQSWWPESTPVIAPAIIVTVVAPTIEAITPCTEESGVCANVTPQPATSGLHAAMSAIGSRLPLLANGARLAPGTDPACYWAEHYGASCSEVKAFSEQYEFNGDNSQ